MRVCYIAGDYYKNKEKRDRTGIEKKILAQVRCLRTLGVNVELAGCSSERGGIPGRIDLAYNTFTAYKKALREYTEDDCIYIRGVSIYLLDAFLLSMQRTPKVVFEIQAIEKDELRPSRQIYFKYKLHKAFQTACVILLEKYIKSRANAVVSVTNEITDHNRTVTGNRLRYLTLGNGVEVSSIPMRHPPGLQDECHVLCVAGVAYWHGLDRFIMSLKDYTGHRKIHLHIVGDGEELPNIKALVSALHLESKVTFYGFRSGKELDTMFNQCHIAIGSLAGFRVNLNELSSLKSREYCARGIPFMMASKDSDFPENWDYIQMVPATEEPIDMNLVLAFAERVMEDSNHHKKMREYAETHLDWLAKMKVLKEFLISI